MSDLAKLLREAAELHNRLANDANDRGHNGLAAHHFKSESECTKAAEAIEAQEPVAWRYGYKCQFTGEMQWDGVSLKDPAEFRDPDMYVEALYVAHQ